MPKPTLRFILFSLLILSFLLAPAQNNALAQDPVGLESQPAPVVAQAPALHPAPPKQPIRVYLVAPSASSAAGCSVKLVAINTGIPRSKSYSTDIKAALKYLFNLKSKYVGGLYNPVSYSTLRVQDVEFTDSGKLKVWLSGKYRPTGNACDNARVKAQIWTTAKQFGAKGTDFYINGPNPFGDFVSNDK